MLPFFAIADWLLTGLVWLLLAACVMSWFPSLRAGALARLVRSVSGPLLHPFRAALPAVGGLDFSPLLAILLLTFRQRLLRAG
jgi:YggT family protein